MVRFMYNTIDDVEGFSVHEVEVDGKRRYVNCIREYGDPMDNCPLCAARMKLVTKLFILLYDCESDQIKIWDRGSTFQKRLESLFARYNPLVATAFDIERSGKPHDMGTTYSFFPVETDETQIEDLPELPIILGGLVLDKDYDELVFFLDQGYFESYEAETVQEEPSRPVRSREVPVAGAASRASARSGRPAPGRNTPEPEKAPEPAIRRRVVPNRKGTDKF